MRLRLYYLTLAFVALIALLPIAYGFFPVNALGPTTEFKSRRTVSVFENRATDPEDEGEEDTTFELGPCVRKCVLRNGPLGPDEALAKRSAQTLQSLQNLTTRRNSLEKRAPSLPAFNGPDDLRRKSRSELNDWMMKRTKKSTDIQWVYESELHSIQIKGTKKGAIVDAGTPSSLFKEPGDEPFAFAAVELVGCTAFTIVKTPTESDPTAAVYMSHIFEGPGFALIDDPDSNRVLAHAMPKVWIERFIQEGFPPPKSPFPGRAPQYRRTYDTPFQEGLNNHGAKLKGGMAIVMHPQRTVREDRDGKEYYYPRDGPQYPEKLKLLKDTINEVMHTMHESALTWYPDYLYLPDRVKPTPRNRGRAGTTSSGRIVFQYDPNFQLGDGRTTRMGMLLIEDGGEQGPRKEYGTYDPGPGGPFFFDFGRP